MRYSQLREAEICYDLDYRLILTPTNINENSDDRNKEFSKLKLLYHCLS